jgi:hypothetical protein
MLTPSIIRINQGTDDDISVSVKWAISSEHRRQNTVVPYGPALLSKSVGIFTSTARPEVSLNPLNPLTITSYFMFTMARLWLIVFSLFCFVQQQVHVTYLSPSIVTRGAVGEQL